MKFRTSNCFSRKKGISYFFIIYRSILYLLYNRKLRFTLWQIFFHPSSRLFFQLLQMSKKSCIFARLFSLRSCFSRHRYSWKTRSLLNGWYTIDLYKVSNKHIMLRILLEKKRIFFYLLFNNLIYIHTYKQRERERERERECVCIIFR